MLRLLARLKIKMVDFVLLRLGKLLGRVGISGFRPEDIEHDIAVEIISREILIWGNQTSSYTIRK